MWSGSMRRSGRDVRNAGLRGLSDTLLFPHFVEPANPIGVNLERDEACDLPQCFIGPIHARAARPSDAAYTKLNNYLRCPAVICF